jgi:hypothetical protein
MTPPNTRRAKAAGAFPAETAPPHVAKMPHLARCEAVEKLVVLRPWATTACMLQFSLYG